VERGFPAAIIVSINGEDTVIACEELVDRAADMSCEVGVGTGHKFEALPGDDDACG
jgi:hypothetical protein